MEMESATSRLNIRYDRKNRSIGIHPPSARHRRLAPTPDEYFDVCRLVLESQPTG